MDVLDDVGLGVLLGTAARVRKGGGDLVVVANRARTASPTSGFDRAVRVAAGLAEVRPMTVTAFPATQAVAPLARRRSRARIAEMVHQ